MTESQSHNASFGVLTEPATLKIQRLLPGPIERVWAYLTDGELRRQWLASGDMQLQVGASFEFVWRNDELTDPAGRRPPDFSEEHRMTCRILAVTPPRELMFTWGDSAEVAFELQEQGDDVQLTVIHRRVSDRAMLLMVSAGWHAHLDILVARLNGATPAPFWDAWNQLKQEYDRRLPG